MTDLPLTLRNSTFRRVIRAPYWRRVNLRTLVVSTRDGRVELAPRAPDTYKIIIDEDEARVLRDVLIRWFG